MLGERDRLILWDQRVGVGDLDERALRQQLGEASPVLPGH